MRVGGLKIDGEVERSGSHCRREDINVAFAGTRQRIAVGGVVAKDLLYGIALKEAL